MAESKKDQFIKLRSQGMSFKAISKKLTISESESIEMSRKHKEEIANRKAIELEGVKAKYSLTEKGRIEIVGTLVSKLKEEIEKRDLSQIPTDKLISLYIKLIPFSEEQEKVQFTRTQGIGEIFDIWENKESWAG